MRYLVLLTLVALLISGCGRIPEPAGYKYSNQQKMQASHHWDILAADVANEINRELIRNDYLDTPVFVRETCGDDSEPCQTAQTTLFNETFRDLLITHLVNLGVPTMASPTDEAIVVNYKAQTVYHQQNRLRTLQPGLITALTTGIIVLRNAPAEVIAFATAGALDFANAAYASLGNFEVVITTSMVAKGSYLYRNSNIYYINDRDSWHYQMAGRPAEIRLTAASAPPAPSAPMMPAAAAPPSPVVIQPEPLMPVLPPKDVNGI